MLLVFFVLFSCTFKDCSLQLEAKYISCKVTKGVLFGVFPGNISTSVKQEVSSVSSHGPESGASAQ